MCLHTLSYPSAPHVYTTQTYFKHNVELLGGQLCICMKFTPIFFFCLHLGFFYLTILFCFVLHQFMQSIFYELRIVSFAAFWGSVPRAEESKQTNKKQLLLHRVFRSGDTWCHSGCSRQSSVFASGWMSEPCWRWWLRVTLCIFGRQLYKYRSKYLHAFWTLAL